MSINYNNITELLDIIYKFVYEPNNEILENFIYKRLDPENISFNDLIKSADFEYQYAGKLYHATVERLWQKTSGRY